MTSQEIEGYRQTLKDNYAYLGSVSKRITVPTPLGIDVKVNAAIEIWSAIGIHCTHQTVLAVEWHNGGENTHWIYTPQTDPTLIGHEGGEYRE